MKYLLEEIKHHSTDHTFKIEIDLYFLTDSEWDNETEHFLQYNYVSKQYSDHIKHMTRAFEYYGDIYIKRSAVKDKDIQRLLLHEIGHVLDLNHTEREGDIMNAHYYEWYGCEQIWV